MGDGGPRPRLGELLAGLSTAADLGTGQPEGWVLRSTLAGLGLAEALHLAEEDRRAVLFLSTLRHLGCTSVASEEASIFGTEYLSPDGLIADARDPVQAMRFLLTVPGRGAGPVARARALGRALRAGAATKGRLETIECEVAGRLAGGLGFGARMVDLIGQVFERWDGKGVPAGLRGDAIAIPVRIAHVAEDAVTLDLWRGRAAVPGDLARRAGRILDPSVVQAFVNHADECLTEPGPSAWDEILRAEPDPHLLVKDLDRALEAVADFADLKSPFLAGHSRHVAAIAGAAAARLGLSEEEIREVRRAGLAHDVGRVAISSAIWDRAGPLSQIEWERVRLHPYFSDRILSRAPALTPLARTASFHHERQDGTGYHRGAVGPSIPATHRILAAADAYCAMTEPRPHREALTPSRGAAELRSEGRDGRLDQDSVESVLDAAGHATRGVIGGPLSQREVEVLRLAARGLTIRTAAAPAASEPEDGRSAPPEHLRQDRRLLPSRRRVVRSGARSPPPCSTDLKVGMGRSPDERTVIRRYRRRRREEGGARDRVHGGQDHPPARGGGLRRCRRPLAVA